MVEAAEKILTNQRVLDAIDQLKLPEDMVIALDPWMCESNTANTCAVPINPD